jgi:hypothetical protein
MAENRNRIEAIVPVLSDAFVLSIGLGTKPAGGVQGADCGTRLPWRRRCRFLAERSCDKRKFGRPVKAARGLFHDRPAKDSKVSSVSSLLRDNLDENGGGSRSVKRRPVAKI